MRSSNGNIFRVTGPLCWEFTGPGEFPTQRPVTRSFDVFFDLRLNKRLSKQPWGWWFETPSLSLWRHCYVWKTCQKQVSRTGVSYYIPQYVWDVITCHCHWIGLHPFKDYTSPSGHFSHKYLILTQMSTCMREVSWTHDSVFQKALSESWMFYGNYEDSAGSYQLAMAYVLVVLLTYFGGLFIILSRYRYTGSMTYTL